MDTMTPKIHPSTTFPFQKQKQKIPSYAMPENCIWKINSHASKWQQQCTKHLRKWDLSIVCCVGTLMNDWSRWLDYWLKQLQSHVPTNIKNSQQKSLIKSGTLYFHHMLISSQRMHLVGQRSCQKNASSRGFSIGESTWSNEDDYEKQHFWVWRLLLLTTFGRCHGDISSSNVGNTLLCLPRSPQSSSLPRLLTSVLPTIYWWYLWNLGGEHYYWLVKLLQWHQ